MKSKNVDNWVLLILLIIIPYTTMAQEDQKMQLANEYYINGDFQKAGDIYSELVKNSANIPSVHTNYFNVLLSLNDYSSAEKYLKKAVKSYPTNLYYQIDQGLLFQARGLMNDAARVYEKIIDDVKNNDFQIRTVAQYFISKQLTDYALKTYLIGRQNLKIESLYALEIANAFRILDKKNEMIHEYLTFASLRESNLRYVKNILQNILQKEEDKENFKTILIDDIQKYPNQPMYGDLLVWINLQEKNFYAALIQAKALDKRFNENGSRILEIGNIALDNKSYDDAINAFNYLIENYPDGRNYIQIRRLIIEAKEEKIKNTFPVQLASIRTLTQDYQKLLDDLGKNPMTIEAYRSKALLHAFYLQEKDSAIQILIEIINTPRISHKIRSQSKLDLGDIYLLISEPWESTLLYSQVEKSNQSNPIGYMAKLKNAQLNYYLGNFELAKSHLDILKLATTREIANDAIALSLLIQDNTALDSSDFVMKQYAQVELLEFQNKFDEAIDSYHQLLVKYAGHTLTDEIHWKLANLYLRSGNFQEALSHLEIIKTQFTTDILGDDAMFKTAFIYQEYLKDNTSAMEIYQAFLTTYPGSVYVAEARKRFRQLRGDNI